MGEHVGAHNTLALGIAQQGIWSRHIDQSRIDPAGLALCIANQPPVLHRRRRRRAIVIVRFHFRCGARPHRLQDCRPLKKAERIVLGKKVEPLGLPARSDMQIGFITRYRSCNHGIHLMLVTERLEFVCNILCCGPLLLDPAHLAPGSAHFQKSSSVIEHDQLFSIRRRASTVRHGCDAIAQEGLLRRHVDIFFGWLHSKVRATCDSPHQRRQHYKKW